MSFSLAVELLNMRLRARAQPVKLRTAEDSTLFD
jgi:hypothetical protein